MSRDYQGEYNSLYKEYLEYTETVDESIKDKTDMDKFYDEYILKYQSKRDYVVDAMNKIASEAKAEGIKIKERPIKYYKIKRSESMDELELRALNTEKDYQREYDKAKKLYLLAQSSKDKADEEYEKAIEEAKAARAVVYEVSKNLMKKHSKEMIDLSDEAKKKGFTLKRSEEETTDIELRALKTLKDYEKAYDDLADEWKKNHAELMKAYSEEKKFSELVDKLEKIEKDINNKLSDLVNKAKKDGFELNQKPFRSEEISDLETRKKEVINKLTNLEERKNAVLDNLEYRAFKNEKECQKAYDAYTKKINDLEDELEKHYSDKAIDRAVEVFGKGDKYKEHKIRNQYEMERDSIKKQIGYLTKQRDKFIDEAKSNGWKLKRSFELDNLEYRALKTQEDYQKEYDKCCRQLASLARDWIDSYEQYKEEIKDYKKNGDKVAVNDLTKQMKKEEQEYHKDAAKVNDKIKTIITEAKKVGYKLKERNIIDFF